MNSLQNKTIVVTGATGRQGSAVCYHLLTQGATVRALTRSPESDKAQKLAEAGAELFQGDMNDPASLSDIFKGADGVYSVQNPHKSSIETEIQQGKNVADAARAAGIAHFIQAAAGIGQTSGVPSWDSKLAIEAHIKSLGLPLTTLRPMAFMELITDKDYYPNASTFYTMPKLMGEDKPVPWISCDDIGAVAARIFANPDDYVGKSLALASDIKSIHELRQIYLKVSGKKAPRFPMPLFMFKLFTGDDLVLMWQYLRDAELDISTEETHAIYPEAQSLETWLQKQF